MAEFMEQVARTTDTVTLVSMHILLPFQLVQYDYGQSILSEIVYNLVLAQLTIVELMWLCFVCKSSLDFPAPMQRTVKKLFFAAPPYGLTYICMILIAVIVPLCFVLKTDIDFLAQLLMWQIIYAGGDLVLSEDETYQRRFTFPIFALAMTLLPVYGGHELTARLQDQPWLASMASFHKHLALSMLMSGVGLALLKRRYSFNILFPVGTQRSVFKTIAECYNYFPVFIFWLVVALGAVQGVNLWVPMVMQQLMHDAGFLLIDDVSGWLMRHEQQLTDDYFEERRIEMQIQRMQNEHRAAQNQPAN